MITYVLHGGKTSIDNSDNNDFFRQFTDLVKKDSVKILLCYLANERFQCEELKKRDTDKILRNTKKTVEFRLVESPQDLFSILDTFDVLYVAGGEAEFLESMYPELMKLKEKLDNKIYIGSSMGTFLASEQYILSMDDQDENTVHKGIGLLPVQTLCHWNIERNKEKKLALLKESSILPILTLDECKYITLYQ